MVFGLLLGLIAAFVWSIVNIIDKYLVDKFCKESGVGSLIILSSLFTVTLLPIALIVTKGDIIIQTQNILVLIFAGVLTTLWISLYLYALRDDDVSIVMPVFQLTPVFALLFAFLLLKELPTNLQLFAVGIIIIGSLIISFESQIATFKFKLLLLVGGASGTIALMNTLFKFVAIDEPFWVSIFWYATGTLSTGILLFIFNKTYRLDFLIFIKDNFGVGLLLNGVNESLTIIGDILFAYALLLAPVALIQTTEATQPIFILFFGIFLSIFAPQILKENNTRFTIWQKIIGISLITSGSILLYLFTK